VEIKTQTPLAPSGACVLISIHTRTARSAVGKSCPAGGTSSCVFFVSPFVPFVTFVAFV